jgi:sigma-B regulation protein RsbU (phosphoserine phosphatase)
VQVASPAPEAPEALRRQQELEQELQLARDIQQGLLLEAVPRLPGWELSAISLPARDLGGDLYDFLPARGGCQGIMIGDVSGKGLPAALRMAVARTVFRHEARRGCAPGPTMAGVNRGVLSEIPQGMVTMLYALLDPRTGTLLVANAGHNYPMLLAGEVAELELSGLPLGVDGDSDYEEAGAVIPPGSSVLLYTDGVTEAARPDGEMFGYERLEALANASRGLKPRALVARLLHELRAWGGGTQDDDITVVALRRRLALLGDELRSIADDVLGAERAEPFWRELPCAADMPVDAWVALLPELLRRAQAGFGRGLARELNQQLRLVIDEYRPQGAE